MTVAVCDSGPLTHLWQIDAWYLFRTFDALHLAVQVVSEIEGHVDLPQLAPLSGCVGEQHLVTLNSL